MSWNSHGDDDAAAEATRRQSALIDFDAEPRGDALDELARLGAPLTPDGVWDAMAERLAVDVGVEVAAINVIDRVGRQTLVGTYPLDFGRLITWPNGFCPHALLGITDGADGAFEVHYASMDPAHRDNSIAQNGFDCYMAKRLMYNGVPIGTVSVVDQRNHQWSDAQRDRLDEAVAEALARLTASGG